MAQNVISQRSWPWKVKVIGQNKWHHQIPWPWKHISRCQIHHPISALLWKFWSKTSFCIMAANVMHSRMSHVQTAQDFFYLLKGPDPSYPVLKFGNNLSSRNRDMAQSAILYNCDLERSKSTMRSIKFCTANRTLPLSIHVKFCWNLIASCLDMVNKSWPGEKRRKDKKKQFDRRWHFVMQITPWRRDLT